MSSVVSSRLRLTTANKCPLPHAITNSRIGRYQRRQRRRIIIIITLLFSNENKNVLLGQDEKNTDNYNNNTTSDNATIRVGRVITQLRRRRQRPGPRRMGFVERALRSRAVEGRTGLEKLTSAPKFRRRAPCRLGLTDRDTRNGRTARRGAVPSARVRQIPRTLYTRLR